jgi:hypothetical protein
MSYEVDKLLQVLPPYQGNELLIKKKQSSKDIIREVIDAHEYFKPDYDSIARFFQGDPIKIMKWCFDFVSNNVRYEIETEEDQTTMSPAAILSLKKGDCKHYSSFVAGVLDSMNRRGTGHFDWHYRFAGYNGDPIGHVFVVVKHQGKEYWIDAAPIPDIIGRFTRRYFNDRLIEPSIIYDLKPKSMSLNRISGVGLPNGFVSTSIVNRADYLTGNTGANNGDCMGRLVSPISYKGEVSDYAPGDNENTGGYEVPVAVQDIPVPQSVVALQETPIPAPGVYQFANIDNILNSFIAASQGYISKGEAAQYLVQGQPLVFPSPTFGAQPPPQDLQVIYPETYRGKPVPAGMPRPIVAGVRIILLPKRDWALLKADNFFWLGFLTSVMAPLVASYSQKPTGNDGFLKAPRHGNAGASDSNLSHTILYDTDKADVVDYVTNMPTKIPILADIPAGVSYMMTNGQPLPFSSARTDMKGQVSIDWFRENNPPALPAFVVNYPSTYLGIPLPSNLPKPVYVNGAVQCLPKGLDWNILKSDNFFWLTFLCSVFAPIIDTYSQYPYSDDENKLAERILYDQDSSDPIGNYLVPPITKTWVGEAVDFVSEVVQDVATVILKFVGIIPRTAFLFLVRFNVKGMAKALKSQLDDPQKADKLIDKWKSIGGTQGDLVDAIEDGAKKKSIGGAIGQTGAEIAAALASAAPIIALLADLLKKAAPEMADDIDKALNSVNKILEQAGLDPIKLADQLNLPFSITDPVTGEQYTIPPPPKKVDKGVFSQIGDFVKANPVQAGIIGLGAGYVLWEILKPKGRKRA